jgi:hypothetical protein
LCAGLTAILASCSGVEAKPVRGGGAEAKPATVGVIDSILPRDVTIARFRQNLPQVAEFSGGAPSREALVRRFVTALERRDTMALNHLLLTPSEFGWLYYPTNPEGLPPYNLRPDLLWFLIQGQNAKGYSRLLQRVAGRPMHLIGHRCEGQPSHQGKNTVWGPCLVLRRTEQGDTAAERFFGLIVERDGTFKFVSYANKL